MHCAAVYATANVSGGHVNPAVTLANCLTGHTSWGRGGLYMVAQLLGAIFGALIEVGTCLTVPWGGLLCISDVCLQLPCRATLSHACQRLFSYRLQIPSAHSMQCFLYGFAGFPGV